MKNSFKIPKNKPERLWTLPFLMVILLNLFNGCAAHMSYPLVAKFSLSLGADLGSASTASGLMSLSALFVCPFAGLLSDRFSRRRILQVSFIGYTVCLIAHLLVRTMPALMALRLLTGIFFSVNAVTVVAFSTGFIPEKRMGEGLGYAALATILAQAIGPGIGLAMADRFGFGSCFLLAGLCALASLVVITLFPKNEDTAPPAAAEMRRIRLANLFAPEMTALMLVTVLLSWAGGLITTYLAIIGDERQIAGIAWYFTVYSLLMVVLRPLAGRIFDRSGLYVLLLPALIFTGLGMWFVGSASVLTVVLLAACCMAVGQGTGVPSIQAHSISRLGQKRAGVAISTIQIGQNIGNAVGPMLGGVFVKAFGYRNMFVGFGIGVVVVGAVLTGVQYLYERRME